MAKVPGAAVVRRRIPRPPGAFGLVVLFLVIITVPGLGLALGIDRATISESEMRELAVWPAWSWRLPALAGWPSGFQRYFEDHFALRSRLIDWRTWLLWHGLGTAPNDQVITGKDGWMFYAADGGIDDWTQAEPFTAPELEAWRETLLRRRAFLTRRGIAFLLVIAPDKQMIYPEYMPGTLRRLRQDYRADQLIAHMRRTTPDFAILDLRPAVLAAKPTELLYHRYDSHWNDRGGLAGYQPIASALHARWPAIVPLQRADFDTDPAVPSGDRMAMLGLTDPGKAAMPGLVLRRGQGYQVIEPSQPDRYGEVGRLVTQHADQSLPTLLMYRDSFAGRLIPYLSEHFRRAIYQWQNEFDFEQIAEEKPDIVIQEYVARHLFVFVPYPALLPTEPD
jgi:alginate O-acetyltransferase complex protein AlgJ